jgi:serine protease SohB
MMEVLEFSLKSLVVVLSLGSLIVLIALMAARARQKNELEVEPLHKKYQDLAFFLKSFSAEKEEIKEEKKRLKAEKKAQKKSKKESPEPNKKKVYVLDFDGDITASQVASLREEITALLQAATPADEVVAKVKSPGGVVHTYGLAASQLLRIRDKGIPLTICVDEVAASGGYMMACTGTKILAAPFAVVGSIGVVAQFPNFNRVLKKYEVDYKEYTAGEFKRTVGPLAEITPKGEQKFKERLEDTHVLFKNFVKTLRPSLDIDKVATGDYWFGEEALALGLIDGLKTSDDYLLSFEKDTPIFELKYATKQSLADKIGDMLGRVLTKAVIRGLTRLESQRFS